MYVSSTLAEAKVGRATKDGSFFVRFLNVSVKRKNNAKENEGKATLNGFSSVKHHVDLPEGLIVSFLI